MLHGLAFGIGAADLGRLVVLGEIEANNVGGVEGGLADETETISDLLLIVLT